MKRELIFLPEVSLDFAEGYNYYERLSPGRGGARFEVAFKRALAEVGTGRITHARFFGHFHRVFLPRFPYNLYYRLAENRAVIVAVLYRRFAPERIEKTLNQRTP